MPRSTIDMVDEYDVQDSLHAILKLFFHAIHAEEWTPSYAGKHTRMDFLLKKEQIVIETKFFGSRLTRSDLIDQLLVDKEHYRQHEDCQKLVCLVYDPDLRCQNPTALEQDLAEIDEAFQVIAIICPRGLQVAFAQACGDEFGSYESDSLVCLNQKERCSLGVSDRSRLVPLASMLRICPHVSPSMPLGELRWPVVLLSIGAAQ